jgi:hypothetical protein
LAIRGLVSGVRCVVGRPNTDRAGSVVITAQISLALQSAQLMGHRRGGRKPDRFADFSHARGITEPLDPFPDHFKHPTLAWRETLTGPVFHIGEGVQLRGAAGIQIASILRVPRLVAALSSHGFLLVSLPPHCRPHCPDPSSRS